MSRGRVDTRERILEAALHLLEEHGYYGVGLGEVARAAGVTRQALYLHFGSKRGLLLALVDWVDRSQGLPELVRKVEEARSALEALDRLIELHATYDLRILKTALVLESARRADSDAAAAWDDRMEHRRMAARRVVKRLAKEGVLAEGWTVAAAADFCWALLSLQARELLVATAGWSQEDFARNMKRAIRRALTTSL
jgi:AcrR family transcriptional regulator